MSKPTTVKTEVSVEIDTERPIIKSYKYDPVTNIISYDTYMKGELIKKTSRQSQHSETEHYRYSTRIDKMKNEAVNNIATFKKDYPDKTLTINKILNYACKEGVSMRQNYLQCIAYIKLLDNGHTYERSTKTYPYHIKWRDVRDYCIHKQIC